MDVGGYPEAVQPVDRYTRGFQQIWPDSVFVNCPTSSNLADMVLADFGQILKCTGAFPKFSEFGHNKKLQNSSPTPKKSSRPDRKLAQ